MWVDPIRIRKDLQFRSYIIYPEPLNLKSNTNRSDRSGCTTLALMLGKALKDDVILMHYPLGLLERCLALDTKYLLFLALLWIRIH
jgi:hypothetical protein